MNWLPDEKRPPGGRSEAAVGEAKVSEHPILEYHNTASRTR